MGTATVSTGVREEKPSEDAAQPARQGREHHTQPPHRFPTEFDNLVGEPDRERHPRYVPHFDPRHRPRPNGALGCVVPLGEGGRNGEATE
jgi:hypothetical protein